MEPVVNHVVVDVSEHETSADGSHDVSGQIKFKGVHHNVQSNVARHNWEDQVILVVGETVMDTMKQEMEGHGLGVVRKPVVFGVE